LSGAEADLGRAARRLGPRIIGAPCDPRFDGMAIVGAEPADKVVAAFVSALDHSLWDIEGQRQNRPLHALLGPQRSTAVPLYANINRRTIDRSPAGFAESARRAVADGYTAIKIAPFDDVRPGSDAGIDDGVARAKAVRDAIGPGRDLLVDCHWRFDEANARTTLDRLAQLKLYWFECPLIERPENFVALGRLRKQANALGIRLAGCEMETGFESFRRFVDIGAYDVLMPDVKYVGGLAEMLRIAAYAAANGVAVAPHNPSGPISHAVSLHISAVAPGFLTLEHQYDESPAFTSIVAGAMPPQRAGVAALPDRPGLGIALAPAALASLDSLIAKAL
jgi:galactonate dehydratase